MDDPSLDGPPDATTQGGLDSLVPGRLVAGRYRLATVASRTPHAWVFNGIDERGRRRVRLRFSSTPPDSAALDHRHPGWPDVLGHGEIEEAGATGRYWVALDWFDGAPLTLAAEGVEKRTHRRAVVVAFLPVLDGLAELHQAGRVHGALGLASLWLGTDGRLRIIDASAPPPDPSGGAVWATPEWLKGLPRTPQTDVYAAGALIQGWVARTPPFGTSDAEARGGHLMRPSPRVDALGAPLQEVVTRAMQKRPDDRWSHAGTLRRALASALRETEPVALPLQGAATVADPDSFERPRLPVARPTMDSLDPTPSAPPAADPVRPRRGRGQWALGIVLVALTLGYLFALVAG